MAAILDAATALLIEDGYAQLSTRKIAARAGIQPGNLQYYFRTKQDVVRALLERHMEVSMQMVESSVAAAGGGHATLDAGIDALLAEHDSAASCRFFWELWALAARDRAVATAVDTFYGRYRAAVGTALRTANPRLSARTAGQRAELIVALLEGLSLRQLNGPPAPAARRAIRSQVRDLVRHLTKETE